MKILIDFHICISVPLSKTANISFLKLALENGIHDIGHGNIHSLSTYLKG